LSILSKARVDGHLGIAFALALGMVAALPRQTQGAGIPCAQLVPLVQSDINQLVASITQVRTLQADAHTQKNNAEAMKAAAQTQLSQGNQSQAQIDLNKSQTDLVAAENDLKQIKTLQTTINLLWADLALQYPKAKSCPGVPTPLPSPSPASVI